MKQGKPLQRRTGLRRSSKPLPRSRLIRHTDMGRGRSGRLRRSERLLADAREAVIERDAGRCCRCGLWISGAWSVHHRLPRGSGGSRLVVVNSPANLILLCGSGTTGCHGWVETHRDAAMEAGWLLRHPADPASARVMRFWRWVLLTVDGRVVEPTRGEAA